VIGHTRFATSSINQVPELHPHEWVPFHDEQVWTFNTKNGRFEKNSCSVGIHITHNGDFDAMTAYSQTMVVDEIGLWLERLLHCPNSTRGDSPKVAGCLDLMRVQGRWAAACRLSWVRTVLNNSTDVSGGEQLSKYAPNKAPPHSFWEMWGEFFDKLWLGHINNVIKVVAPGKFDLNKNHYYQIDQSGLTQFQVSVVKEVINEKENSSYGIQGWSESKITAFVHHAIRGFLRGDLYTAMTELLSRAEGSFGLQAHCTLEPGVVVIASKGQPMSIAFDPLRPIVLFASEAEALAVPVYKSGKWLPERIDLDSHGEIFRLGQPRPLLEGSFGFGIEKKGNKKVPSSTNLTKKKKEPTSYQVEVEKRQRQPFILLDCGVEIRCYSLVTHTEAPLSNLIERSVSITSAPIPYNPKVDLVAGDLRVTPAVLAAIDHGKSIILFRSCSEATYGCMFYF
jgi:hypothetical protein